jgi:hypothetical protein
VSVGDGDGVGGTGDGVRVDDGSRVTVTAGKGDAVRGSSTGVMGVSTPWQAVRNNNRVIQNLFPISLYRKARFIE